MSGYLCVFDFSVYDSFESQAVAKTGIVQMAASGESVVGGHAVMAVGYDDSQQRFILHNSWGENWRLLHRSLGLPDGAQSASDFWAIRLVQS